LSFEGTVHEEELYNDAWEDWVVSSEGEEARRVEDEVVAAAAAAEWELDVGDSCCFGTRTVSSIDVIPDVARDCLWKIHGSV